MLQNKRYAIALGAASLHLFGSLLLTMACIKKRNVFDSASHLLAQR